MRRALIQTAGAIGKPLLVAALVAVLAAASARSRTDDSVLTSSRSGSFTIRGHVVGLYPGRTGRLTLTITNGNRFPIRVRSVRVKVADAAGCSRSNLVVRRFRGSLRVPARSKRRVKLPIKMRRTAPDTCMGARFPLRYFGRAVK